MAKVIVIAVLVRAAVIGRDAGIVVTEGENNSRCSKGMGG